MAPGSGCSPAVGSGAIGASAGSPEAGAVLVDLRFAFFGLATGLAVVTVTAGNCTVSDACGAAGCDCPCADCAPAGTACIATATAAAPNATHTFTEYAPDYALRML